jgi:hypothetical protein
VGVLRHVTEDVDVRQQAVDGVERVTEIAPELLQDGSPLFRIAHVGHVAQTATPCR